MINPLRTLKKISKTLYFRALRSIAFYPVLISTIFVGLAVTILYVEEFEFFTAIQDKLPYLFIQDDETARTLLSVMIGGILSLTVFSFTMVMVVLNQASANFSPRLLPGLVSNKRHQIILGLYIGTLLYSILVLISLGAYGVDSNSMGLSTTLAAVFGVICVAVFVYFIHMISGAIQIHNIIDRIYASTDASLDRLNKKKNDSTVGLQFNDNEGWSEIKAIKSGYFRGFDADLIGEEMRTTDNRIEVVPYVGQHIWAGDPVLRTAQLLAEKEIDDLRFCTAISSNRHVENDTTGGMIQLMEIAVKALSPGINDPGTAIAVISHLGNLLVKSLCLPSLTSQLVNEGPLILINTNIPAEETIRLVVQPIRTYAKQDSTVLHELIKVLQYVRRQNRVPETAKKVLEDELTALEHDIAESITNPADKDKLLDTLKG